jgi:methionine synthase I (cobalamin-dependent)
VLCYKNSYQQVLNAQKILSQEWIFSSDGKTGYEIKRVTQNKYQTFEASANNIIRNIKAQHAATLDGSEKFIVDLVETAHDVETQKRIYQYINQELSKQGLETDSLIYLFN